MPLVQVREAARGLGVHENTLRRWEERGLIKAVRLPTGVRRFRSEDIRALRAQMFSGFAPADAEELPAVRGEPID
jgi:excisionase family DNA binding protein